MNPIKEGNITFSFIDGMLSEKYEAWTHYVKVFQSSAPDWRTQRHMRWTA